MSIREQLQSVRNSLPQHVTLVAVSKTKPVEAVLEAYTAGQRIFGENKVQELVAKQEQLPQDIQWHLIGHLQTNKVKFIAPFVSLIHSVDSLKLLSEINKQAIKNNRTIDCLLQIHIAEEETKFGMSFEEAEQFLTSDQTESYPNARIVGLMGMATNTEDDNVVRMEFKKLKNFFSRMNAIKPMIILSMGMSHDHRIAIEEGSNMVRIGSAIFGER